MEMVFETYWAIPSVAVVFVLATFRVEIDGEISMLMMQIVYNS